MSRQLKLPNGNGEVVSYSPLRTPPLRAPENPSWNRTAFAAAHVVCDPLKTAHPSASKPDWEETLRFRDYLLKQGFFIAEAMDTSQRGMGLDYPDAKALIGHSLSYAGGKYKSRIYCGAGTDQNPEDFHTRLESIIDAYQEQAEWIEKLGGGVILMASRALARVAKSPEDYIRVYEKVLGGLSKPAILHWLGDCFDPKLKGYWGSGDFETAMETCLAVIRGRPDKVDGIKLSLLSAEKEKKLRAKLPSGVRMYTGDDFNYPELIAGDGDYYSDALLGIFDPIAPAASLALQKLAEGKTGDYHRIFGLTLPLARKIFEAPTMYYKAGVVFLAYLNGHQSHFAMLGGMQGSRSVTHYSEVFRLADQAGLLLDPDLAIHRMRLILALHGLEN